MNENWIKWLNESYFTFSLTWLSSMCTPAIAEPFSFKLVKLSCQHWICTCGIYVEFYLTWTLQQLNTDFYLLLSNSNSKWALTKTKSLPCIGHAHLRTPLPQPHLWALSFAQTVSPVAPSQCPGLCNVPGTCDIGSSRLASVCVAHCWIWYLAIVPSAHRTWCSPSGNKE